MTVQIIALVLLLVRLTTIGLTTAVLIKQYQLFRLTIENELVHFRVTLFLLTVVFLVGSFIPTGVDIYFGFIETDAAWSRLLVYYAVSNSLSFLAASFLLWKVYDIVGGSLELEQEVEDIAEETRIRKRKS